ncbi:MAG: hypothetical protein ACOCYW_05465 [Roseicyclus sp.]
MVDARDIYQDFLDRVSGLLMAGEISAIVDCMICPQEIRTLDGFLKVTTARQMFDVVSDFRAFLMGFGTTDYHRICDWAEIDEAGETITGEHMTYVLRGGGFAMAPIRSRMILRRVDGAWRGAGNCAEVSNRAFTLLSPEQLRSVARSHP